MADEPVPDPAPEPEPQPAPQGAPEGGPPPPDAPPAALPQAKHVPDYFPIIVTTCCFGALFIILPLLVRKGPHRGLARWCIMLSLFWVWLFWVTVYIAQMNPIMGPRMHNTTLAWIAYKIGNPVKSPAHSDEGEPEAF